MMTRTMTATNGITQTDELVTSEFTQAVEQGRVNTAVYDTGSYTITGTYYPAATAGEATADAFNTAFNALNSGMASSTGARPTIVQTQELAASKLGSEHNYTCTWVGSDSLGQLMAAHPTIQYSVRLASPWGSILASILPILIIAGLLLFFLLPDEQGKQFADVVRQGKGEEKALRSIPTFTSPTLPASTKRLRKCRKSWTSWKTLQSINLLVQRFLAVAFWWALRVLVKPCLRVPLQAKRAFRSSASLAPTS